MRIKTFTLMVLALLMSTMSFAQKPIASSKALMQNVSFQKKSTKAPLQGIWKAKKAGSQQVAASKKAPAKAPDEVVTPPADSEPAYYTATGTGYVYGGLEDGWIASQINRTATVIWDGTDEVYIKGLSYYMQNSYLYGAFKGESDTIVFPRNQFLGDDLGVELYAVSGDDDDIIAVYDESDDSFTFITQIYDTGKETPEGRNWYAYMDKGLVLSQSSEVDLPVEIPADLETSDYIVNAYSGYTPVSFTVKIGFKGDDVYLQGASQDYLPLAWIKGKLEDGMITFPTGQLLGDKYGYSFWFLGYSDASGVQDMIFDYDAEKGLLSSTQLLFINVDKTDLGTNYANLAESYWNIYIQKVTEMAGTPATSSPSGINFYTDGPILELGIKLKDTEENGLVADKLTYKVYYDNGDGEANLVTFSKADYKKLEADMTEVPYNFSDDYDFISGPSVYLNMKGYETWKRIGLQTIYYGGDEKHESEIGWYTPIWPIYDVTLPEGLTKTINTFKGFTPSNSDEEEEEEESDEEGVAFERTVVVAMDADTMYIQGLGTQDETTWVKGVKTADDTYTFANAQFLGTYRSYELFLVGLEEDDDDEDVITDVVLKKDAANGVYTFQSAVLENAGRTDKQYYYTKYLAGATISINGEVKAPVTVPEDLVAVPYSYNAYDYFDKVDVVKSANIGIKGNDVYVQGFSTSMPNAWVKGTLADGKVTFKSGQLLGDYNSDTELYFLSYNTKKKEAADLVLNYDAEKGAFLFADSAVVVVINPNSATQYASQVYQRYQYVKFYEINEIAATPATPVISALRFSPVGDALEFTVPMQDVDGNDIVADKLTYVLLADNGEGEPAVVTFSKDEYDKIPADMTEVPATFVDSWDFYDGVVYLNMDHSTWKRIGLKSIYRGAGEIHESEIAWYTPTWPIQNTLPEGLTVSTHEFNGNMYNMSTGKTYPQTSKVQLATDGDDLYIQGLGRTGTTGWIKGTKNEDGNYVFSNAQEMGAYEYTQGSYSIYFVGAGVDEDTQKLFTTDVVLAVDPINGVFQFQNHFCENVSYTDTVNPYTFYLGGATIAMAESADAINGVVADGVAGKAARYNVAGQRVGANYKGLVISNGKKYLVK